MFANILNWIISNIYLIIGAAGIGGLLAIVLRKFIKKDVLTVKLDNWLRENGKNVQAFFGGLGRIVTLNATHWPVVGLVWNKVIEPYLIFAVQLLFKVAIWFIHNAVEGFINRGLLSDNPNFAGESKSEAKASAKVLNK